MGLVQRDPGQQVEVKGAMHRVTVCQACRDVTGTYPGEPDAVLWHIKWRMASSRHRVWTWTTVEAESKAVAEAYLRELAHGNVLIHTITDATEFLGAKSGILEGEEGRHGAPTGDGAECRAEEERGA